MTTKARGVTPVGAFDAMNRVHYSVRLHDQFLPICLPLYSGTSPLPRSFSYPFLRCPAHHNPHQSSPQEKQKAKEAASAASMMASSLKSTLGSLFESSPSTSTATTPSKSSSHFPAATSFPSFARSASAVSSSSTASPRRKRSEDQALEPASAAAAPAGTTAPTPRSMMNRLASMKEQMPSLRDLLFDDAPTPSGPASGGSRASSRHGGGGGAARGGAGNGYTGGSSSRHNKPLSSSTNKPPSESGATVREVLLILLLCVCVVVAGRGLRVAGRLKSSVVLYRACSPASQECANLCRWLLLGLGGRRLLNTHPLSTPSSACAVGRNNNGLPAEGIAVQAKLTTPAVSKI